MCSEIRSIIFSCQLEGVCVLKKGVYILLPVRGGMCSEIRGIIFFSQLEGVCVLK